MSDNKFVFEYNDFHMARILPDADLTKEVGNTSGDFSSEFQAIIPGFVITKL